MSVYEHLEKTVQGSLLLLSRDAVRQGQGSLIELHLQTTSHGISQTWYNTTLCMLAPAT